MTCLKALEGKSEKSWKIEKIGKSEKRNQSLVMNEEFVKNIVMNEEFVKTALRFRRQDNVDRMTVFVDSDYGGDPVSRARLDWWLRLAITL